MTTFSKRDLIPWRYPTPFDFHFSERIGEPAYESGTALRRMGRSGEDPAAHLTETRARGVVLLGLPIESVLPTVPLRDFLDSVVSDFRWGLRKLNENATIDRRMALTRIWSLMLVVSRLPRKRSACFPKRKEASGRSELFRKSMGRLCVKRFMPIAIPT